MEANNVASMPADLERDGWSFMSPRGFIGLAGPYVTRSRGAGNEYGFRADERHLNPLSVVHGGCLFTFLDSVLGWEAIRDAKRDCVTIQFDVQFVSGARSGDFITAQPEVVRRTKNLVFMRGTLTTHDSVVMIGAGVWKII